MFSNTVTKLFADCLLNGKFDEGIVIPRHFVVNPQLISSLATHMGLSNSINQGSTNYFQ